VREKNSLLPLLLSYKQIESQMQAGRIQKAERWIRMAVKFLPNFISVGIDFECIFPLIFFRIKFKDKIQKVIYEH
jgi:hypothetical protein